MSKAVTLASSDGQLTPQFTSSEAVASSEKKLTSTPSSKISISDKDRIQRLREVIDERDETILQLRKELELLRYGGDPLQQEFRALYPELCHALQPFELKLLVFLWHQRPKILSKERIMHAIYDRGIPEHLSDPMKVADVYICRIRKQIAAFGIKELFILTEWGRGYGIVPLSETQETLTKILRAANTAANVRSGLASKVYRLLQNEVIPSNLDSNEKKRWSAMKKAIYEVTQRSVIEEEGRIWLSPNLFESDKIIS